MKEKWAAVLIITGLALCAAGTAWVLVTYPNPDLAGFPSRLAIAILALLFAAMIALVGRSKTSPERRVGGIAGALGGLIWIGEISFNNFTPIAWRSAETRLWVDDGAWAVIALLVLLAAFSSARRRGFTRALATGGWAGLVSGTLACLMGLNLVRFWMGALVSDPLSIQEFHDLRPTISMEAYFAWETTAGALMHLFILGIAMGYLLGALGGGLGRALRARA